MIFICFEEKRDQIRDHRRAPAGHRPGAEGVAAGLPTCGLPALGVRIPSRCLAVVDWRIAAARFSRSSVDD